MAKIGRNDPCPCGSGRKFKRCCLGKQQAASANLTEVQQAQISLQNAISTIQKAATQGVQKVHELGVFVLFSTTGGDAWLLEVSQADGLQVAADKEILTVDFEENPETIEINWTHTFAIKDKQFVITAYKDKSVSVILVCSDNKLHTRIRVLVLLKTTRPTRSVLRSSALKNDTLLNCWKASILTRSRPPRRPSPDFTNRFGRLC